MRSRLLSSDFSKGHHGLSELSRVSPAVARRASHRSGRAQLRHPARQATASPFRFVIRWRCVDLKSGYGDLGRFPANGSVARHSLPSTGSPRSECPGVSGTMKCSDVLRPSRRASLPSLGATMRCVGRFAPIGPARTTVGRGFVIRSPLPDFFAWRRSGPPRFLENPGVLMPCSLTPAGPNAPGHTVRRHGPRSQNDEGSHLAVISGLYRTASALAVYASPGGLPAQDARLASGCWPSSTRRD